jgi:glucosyl-3-phosphoglycerate synthase
MLEKKSIIKNTYHHSNFSDIRRLVELKEKQAMKISLAFPTLNEAKTIGKEILIIKTELMNRFPLIDEIAVIDSGSSDDTCRIAREFGAAVHSSKDILRHRGTYRGKGENLWKSLYVLAGDIIVWIDADIKNIHPKFVYGLVGPLLEHPNLSYVKAFYERPLSVGGTYGPGGGRVTEILVRPLFSMFFPELAQLVQPLSGEYASRRGLLENLSFSVGYGVELGHLVDIYELIGPGVIGQVDLDRRIHRNQTLSDLGRMSFGILATFFNRLEKYYHVNMERLRNDFYSRMVREGEEYDIKKIGTPVVEREPMNNLREYREKFYRQGSSAAGTSGDNAWWKKIFKARR